MGLSLQSKAIQPQNPSEKIWNPGYIDERCFVQLQHIVAIARWVGMSQSEITSCYLLLSSLSKNQMAWTWRVSCTGPCCLNMNLSWWILVDAVLLASRDERSMFPHQGYLIYLVLDRYQKETLPWSFCFLSRKYSHQSQRLRKEVFVHLYPKRRKDRHEVSSGLILLFLAEVDVLVEVVVEIC